MLENTESNQVLTSPISKTLLSASTVSYLHSLVLASSLVSSLQHSHHSGPFEAQVRILLSLCSVPSQFLTMTYKALHHLVLSYFPNLITSFLLPLHSRHNDVLAVLLRYSVWLTPEPLHFLIPLTGMLF